jgi:hypothetical protein
MGFGEIKSNGPGGLSLFVLTQFIQTSLRAAFFLLVAHAICDPFKFIAFPSFI